MKKIKILVASILIIFGLMLGSSVNAKNGVPYKTYAVYNNELRETQTAYLPVGVLNNNYNLNNPNDIYIKDNYVYVANTGAKNIIVFDVNGNFVKEIGFGLLAMPMGVFVSNDNLLYVADKELQSVIVFDTNGEYIKQYDRPTEALFGTSASYKPEKIVVDSRGNLFITGEGAVNGVIQLNKYGNFLGYFAVNQTKYDWRMLFSNLLNLKNVFAKNLPPAPSNLAIDKKGLIYTVTPNNTTNNETIKKFNLASQAILKANMVFEEENPIDVIVDIYDNTFVITDKGVIYALDNQFNLLFIFGGLDNGQQRVGLLGSPSAISVDEMGNLYTLDKSYNQIQIYNKTSFTNLVYEATNLYQNGKYDESKEIWEDVLLMNNNFAIANKALGNILIKEEDFKGAMEYYKVAQDRFGYQKAFWEVRNSFLSNHSEGILLGIIILIVIFIILKIFKINKIIKKSVKSYLEKIKKVKVIDDLLFVFRILRHPLDGFYKIKHEKKVSVSSALILYGILFIFIISSYFITSFIFNYRDLVNLNLLLEFGIIFALLTLWILANYLISTLFDGEGWFKDVFIATIYALAPIIIFIVPIALLSNVLTYNELFVYDLLRYGMYAWSILLLFFMVKDVHNYTVGGTIKNIILTIFTMIIMALLIFICYLLISQLFEFIIGLFKELIIRVRY